ncbi:hypothetical protein NUW58_g10216 [Xylaria curta]|uniref:Uncharacterized protein n=1 Tax=Xylaria curta TaxID=42375 RepID=A0ACC1MQB0_9PEZI|nr:hypothetical protein NUW58_g10216 [Xylaria curta]
MSQMRRHPLLDGQLNLAGEVVEMPYQSTKDQSVARRDVGTHGVEHMLGKRGIESRKLRRCAALDAPVSAGGAIFGCGWVGLCEKEGGLAVLPDGAAEG